MDLVRLLKRFLLLLIFRKLFLLDCEFPFLEICELNFGVLFIKFCQSYCLKAVNLLLCMMSLFCVKLSIILELHFISV